MIDVYDFINNESNGWEEIINIENLIKQDNTPIVQTVLNF